MRRQPFPGQVALGSPSKPAAPLWRQMRFGMICEANGIEHRLTKPIHS